VPIVSYVGEADADAEVAAIYAEIRSAFGLPFVPNLFRALAHRPSYLAATWDRVKLVMAPGALDRRTKEIVAVAVSATNGCDYCVDAHSAALRRLGMDDAAFVELMAVVDLFNGLNALLGGLRVDSDPGS
jgi:AhpD family alkylhydroperoxidase